MIKLNWPIKNLIMSFNLIFMQIHQIIIQFDLEFALFFSIFRHNGVRLGLEFPSKLQFIPWLPFSTLPTFILIF